MLEECLPPNVIKAYKLCESCREQDQYCMADADGPPTYDCEANPVLCMPYLIFHWRGKG